MSGLLRFLYLLGLVVWIGEIVFFSFIGAPAIFGVLGSPRAGDVVAAIFPRYYAVGTVAATIAVGCALMLGRRSTAPGWWMAAVVSLVVGLAATAWAGAVVHPRAQRLRAAVHAADPAAPPSDEFRRAHRLAVLLNGTALLAGLVGLGFSAAALRE